MEVSKIIQDIESDDPHTILDGVWSILECTDVEYLKELKPFVKQWRGRVRKINLGGAFYRNSNHFDLAMSYIENMCNGGCHCSIYGSTSLFSPENHAKRKYVSIDDVTSDVEKYETIFEVHCLFCGKKFTVTEFIGGHIPWYQWCIA
ncbi:MAG: hypothetical protein GY781_14595 [Gammaproteobacteria bacterium]|nr:hypothetical protein [Gammaproteobacteria bacterium]